MTRIYTLAALALLLLSTRSHAQMQAFIMPTPVGGKHWMEEFIMQELNYPEKALDLGISGEVWVKFNVMQDGHVEEMRIWQGLEPACDAEALRLANMIQWQPGYLGNAPVDAEHSMCITFSPKHFQKWRKKRHVLPDDVMAIPVSRQNTIHAATRTDQQPAPILPDGSQDLPRWWQRNLQYPAEALRRNIEGSIKVRFVIEPSGNISNVHALNDLGGGCVQETIRMLRSIPWRPAVVNNERVRSQMEMEFFFRLP